MAEATSDDKEMETSGQNEGGIPYKVKAGAFLAFAGGFGLLAGFGGALAQVRGCSVILFCQNIETSASAYARSRSRTLGPMTWGQGNLWKRRNRQGAKAVFGLSANRCGLVIFQYNRKLAQQMAKMSEEQRAELVRARKAVALQVFLIFSRRRLGQVKSTKEGKRHLD